MIDFRVSSYCNFGNCVEVGATPDGSTVIVRDTKDMDRLLSLAFTREDWANFVRDVKVGGFEFG